MGREAGHELTRPHPQRLRLPRRPDGARGRAHPRRLRDEDDPAAPAPWKPTAADRRDRPRDAELDRPAGPRDRRLRQPTTCRGSPSSGSRSGSRSAASRPRTTRLCASGSTGTRGRAAIELNLSCPNVEEAPETAAELVAAARAATGKPSTRSSHPPTWDVAESARAVVGAGADGLSLVNTIRGLALDPARCARGCAAVGGYSRDLLCADRARVRPRLRGGGRRPDRRHGRGRTGPDALELVAAGASSVAGHRPLRRSGRAAGSAPSSRRAAVAAWSDPPDAKRIPLSDQKSPCKSPKTVLLDRGVGC